ncbi:Annexin repeat, partial [Dillenia turbinata]
NAPTNDQNLVEILLRGNSQEFKHIRHTYYTLYHQDLLEVVSTTQKCKLLLRAICLRMREPQERDAEILRNSIYGGSINFNILIEIVCTRPSSELHCIKLAYGNRYHSDIEQDVALKTTGGFKEVFMHGIHNSMPIWLS